MSSSELPGPPPTSIINLAIAELCIYAVLFIPTLWITWKHGKQGMTCWTLLVSYFPLRFASDITQIINRNEPQVANVTLIVTEAGTIACLTLTLIGLVYESYIILPVSGKGWIEKAFLVVTHLTNTTGIAMATYAGSPSRTGGVINPMLNKVGNLLMLGVILLICLGIVHAWQRAKVFPGHPNFRNARYLLLAAAIAMPFQIIRLVYNTTYAFERDSNLDPVMGTFATQFILMFLLHLGVVLAAVTGGWRSRQIMPRTFSSDDMIVLGSREQQGDFLEARAGSDSLPDRK